jgi:hypothetical protein
MAVLFEWLYSNAVIRVKVPVAAIDLHRPQLQREAIRGGFLRRPEAGSARKNKRAILPQNQPDRHSAELFAL